MAGSGQRIAIRKIVSEVLRSGYMLQASGSTLGSAMIWTPLVMARAGREFSNCLAAGPPRYQGSA
jgi:hypothetical protein